MNNQKQSKLFDRLHQKYQNISLYGTKDREKLDLKNMDIKEIDETISEQLKTCLVEVSSSEEKSETLSQFQQSSLKRGK